MAASRIPPEVFEMILQFAPDNSFIGFKIDKQELQEDAKITNRKNQFGAITIRSPNQLRLLNRLALAYVHRWKSSQLLCEIWMRSDQKDFSKAEVALSFLHSNAVPLVGRILRKRDRHSGYGYQKSGLKRLDEPATLPAEGAFKGLLDLASSCYAEHVLRIELHVHISWTSNSLSRFCGWFHEFWLYVVEQFPSAATLPTYVDLTCSHGIRYNQYRRPVQYDENWSERGVFQEMPNNFQRLDFRSFRTTTQYFHPGSIVPGPLLTGCVDFIFFAGRATINHIAGFLPSILSLGFQPDAAAARSAFPAVKRIDATFNEYYNFVGNVNPFAQLVSIFPSLESLNLHSCRANHHQTITIDLSPLLQFRNLNHFQFGGDHAGWSDYYVDQFANEPLSRWNIQHPGIRSIRLDSAENQDSDDMPAEHIVALRKLLNLNATSYDCLELIKMFSVQQFSAIFDAYSIFPKVAALRRLSMHIGYTIERDTEELLHSIVRLFALIERTMPHLSTLYFGATTINIDHMVPETGTFEFARCPEIALLWRFIANRPKQLKELILNGILHGPGVSIPCSDEQWLVCVLRCLVESNLSRLVVLGTLRGVDWPLPFFQRWNANQGSIKDLFKSLPPAATKGKRLQSVKFYTRKRDEEFPCDWDHPQTVELCCVLANTSTGETQTLRLLAGAWNEITRSVT